MFCTRFCAVCHNQNLSQFPPSRYTWAWGGITAFAPPARKSEENPDGRSSRGTMGTEMGAAVEPAAQDDVMVFGGEKRNMAMGIAMFGAGAAAFISGLTDTFFAEAIAWTFMLWGIFFIYGDLLLTTRRFEVREDGLTPQKSLPPVEPPKRVRAWQDINRMDIVMQRRDLKSRRRLTCRSIISIRKKSPWSGKTGTSILSWPGSSSPVPNSSPTTRRTPST